MAEGGARRLHHRRPRLPETAGVPEQAAPHTPPSHRPLTSAPASRPASKLSSEAASDAALPILRAGCSASPPVSTIVQGRLVLR